MRAKIYLRGCKFYKKEILRSLVVLLQSFLHSFQKTLVFSLAFDWVIKKRSQGGSISSTNDGPSYLQPMEAGLWGCKVDRQGNGAGPGLQSKFCGLCIRNSTVTRQDHSNIARC